MDFFQDVYENHLQRYGFAQVQQREREGHLFALDSQAVRGRYWVYAHYDFFAVSEIELALWEDFPMEFKQPADIQIIAQYDRTSGVSLCGTRRGNPGDIRECLPRGTQYQVLYGGGKRVCGASITLGPAFCEEYLGRKYPGDMPQTQPLLRGAPMPPDISRALREIRHYRGRGLSAKLYYESKVLETLSLLLRETKEAGLAVSGQDLARMEEAKAFIEAHYSQRLSIDCLARLACMSPTKLKAAFKAATGLTVARYVTQARMEKAAARLRETGLPIAEIAREVGYQKAGAFADGYRACTGYLPSETRKRGLP